MEAAQAEQALKNLKGIQQNFRLWAFQSELFGPEMRQTYKLT